MKLRMGMLAFCAGVIPCAAHAADYFTETLVQAYETHPRLGAARRQYEAQTEELAKAMAGFYPNLNASWQKGEQSTKFGNFDDSRSMDVKALNLEQPLFRGGQTYYAVKAARRSITAQQAELQQVETETLLAAASAYVDVIQAGYMLQLSQKNLELLRENKRITEEKLRLGEVTRTDAEQSEARLQQAQVQVQRAHGRLLDARAAYRQATGGMPAAELTPPRYLPNLPASLTDATELAKAQHFPLAAAKARHEAADYAVDTSIGRLLPQVSLIGSIQQEDGGTNSIFAGGNTYESDIIAVRVSIPLYQTGAEYAQVRQNKSLREQRRYDVRDTEQQMEESLARLWQQWQTAQQNLRADKAAAEAATRALDGVKQEQALGERTVLDVLNAEQERFQFQMSQVQDGRDAIIARLQILALTGELTAQKLALPVKNYDMAGPEKLAAFHPIGF